MVAVANSLASEIGEGVRDAQEKLRRAMQIANLHNDPLGAVIEAQIATLDAQHRLAISGVQQIEAAKQPINSEEMRRAVIQGISVHARGMLDTMGWRNAILAAGILVLTLIVGAGGGYWLGHRTGLTEIAPFATMAPAEAAGWSRLMRENSAVNAIFACEKGEILKAVDGRRACAMPVWLDPASTAPPVSR